MKECCKVAKRYTLKFRLTKDRSKDMAGKDNTTLFVDDKVVGSVVGAEENDVKNMRWLLFSLWERSQGLGITPSIGAAADSDENKVTSWVETAGYRLIPALDEKGLAVYVLEHSQD
jgi:hypothetical protein